MFDRDLIQQLGDILGRPLDPLPEDRFERHTQANDAPGGTKQDRVTRDAYALAEDGTVSGLFLAPVTSHILLDFPFQEFRHLKYLCLRQVNVSSFEWVRELTGLTTLDLRYNRISDGDFLRELTGLTTLDLRYNRISDGDFLRELTGLTTLDLRYN
ncbi:MAG: leucine-rich repeat domain-containing protein, partial [Cyanobacteria bacterium P01_A01_bin.37]